MSLWSDFLGNDQRLIHKWTHYFPIYEAHFARYRNRPVTIFEIGCYKGGSLQMWKRWFGARARIVGLDIDTSCARFEEPQIAVRIGNQADTRFLQAVIDEFGPPDIVLDDGSHIMEDINETFSFLYPRMSTSGVYMVEDLHTAYWPEFGGGVRKEGSFIEISKSLIDELNAYHSRGTVQPTAFTDSTVSINIYDSIIAFERGRRVETRPMMTGGKMDGNA